MAKIFISFAAEDHQSRDVLVGQAKTAKSPFEFVFMSNKQPWIPMWKTRCRQEVRGCHGLIALISKRTRNAEGVRWEMQCAREAAIPLIGVHVDKFDKVPPPPELADCRIIEWSWDEIARFLQTLEEN